ncbi:MAG: fibro-slime domain-containing protein [Clostridiales bacterium]|nr:fibro-slime domain-containing protein [Clostridiales bacterium]
MFCNLQIRRIISFLLVFIVLASSSVVNYAAEEAEQPRQVYSARGGNGRLNSYGNVSIEYNSWELEALASWSEEYDETFAPSDGLLQALSEEDAAAFDQEYGNGRWLLLDTAYSMAGLNPALTEIDISLLSDASVSYLLKDRESESYRIIVHSKDDDKFDLHLESASSGKYISASLAALGGMEEIASDAAASGAALEVFVEADETASQSYLVAEDESTTPQAIRSREESRDPLSETPKEDAKLEPELKQGQEVDFATGSGGVYVLDIEIADAPRLMRVASTSSTLMPPASIVTPLNASNYTYFPVTFYDYEGTTMPGTDTLVKGTNNDSILKRTVFPSDPSNTNFNTPELLAAQYGTNYVYRGNPLESYFLFNPLYMPKYPSVYDFDSKGRQNVNFIRKPYSVNDLGYGDGLTMGIAKPTLENGFQVNFRTMNNLQLFPEISSPNSNEVFIYGYDTSGDNLGNQSSAGYQYTTKLNDSLGMITAYPNYNFPFFFDSDDGFYKFDSDTSHVHVDPTLNSKDLILHEGKQNNYGFFPLDGDDENNNNYADSLVKPTYDSDGVIYDDEDLAIKKNLNYNFGMSMAFEFMLPPAKAGDPDIVYEFAGDDDIWVYIDGKLALDLGGTHKRVNGQINFTQGTVTISSNEDIYKIIPGSLSGEAVEFEQIKREGIKRIVEADLDIDYSKETHTFQLFYMERSPDESNCSMKFNFPMALTLIKESNGVYGNFDFKVDIEIPSSGGEEEEEDEGENSPTPTPDYTLTTTENVPYAATAVELPSVPWGTELTITVTEIPDSSSTEDYSTIFLGSGQTQTTEDKTFTYTYKYGTVGAIYCLNYRASPISGTKYDYDKYARDPNASSAALSGIEFKLYKEEISIDNYLEEIITTNPNGTLSFENVSLDFNTVYVLEETSAPGYEILAPIYFETTSGGLSPRIKEVWQLDSVSAKISAESEEPLPNGLHAMASADGLSIKIFNKKLYGSITVKKDVEELFTGSSNPIFRFKLTRTDGYSVVKSISYGETVDNECVFDGLELGTYTVTELKTPGYKLKEIKDKDDTIVTSAEATITANNLHESEFTFVNEPEDFQYLYSNAVKTNEVSVSPPPQIAGEAPDIVNVKIYKSIEDELGGRVLEGSYASIYVVSGDYMILPNSLQSTVNQIFYLNPNVALTASPTSENATSYRPLEPIWITRDENSEQRYIVLYAPSSSGPATPTPPPDPEEIVTVYIYRWANQNGYSDGDDIKLDMSVEYVSKGATINLPDSAMTFLLPDGASRPGASNTDYGDIGFDAWVTNKLLGTATTEPSSVTILENSANVRVIVYRPAVVSVFTAGSYEYSSTQNQHSQKTGWLQLGNNHQFIPVSRDSNTITIPNNVVKAYELTPNQYTALSTGNTAASWNQIGYVNYTASGGSTFDDWMYNFYSGATIHKPGEEVTIHQYNFNQAPVFIYQYIDDVIDIFKASPGNDSGWAHLEVAERSHNAVAINVTDELMDVSMPVPYGVVAAYVLPHSDLVEVQSLRNNNEWFGYDSDTTFKNWLMTKFSNAEVYGPGEEIVINDFDPVSPPVIIYQYINDVKLDIYTTAADHTAGTAQLNRETTPQIVNILNNGDVTLAVPGSGVLMAYVIPNGSLASLGSYGGSSSYNTTTGGGVVDYRAGGKNFDDWINSIAGVRSYVKGETIVFEDYDPGNLPIVIYRNFQEVAVDRYDVWGPTIADGTTTVTVKRNARYYVNSGSTAYGSVDIYTRIFVLPAGKGLDVGFSGLESLGADQTVTIPFPSNNFDVYMQEKYYPGFEWNIQNPDYSDYIIGKYAFDSGASVPVTADPNNPNSPVVLIHKKP